MRAEAEAVLAGSKPAPVAGAPEKLQHELAVYQIELAMQNEELLRSQAALAESRERNLDLVEFAPLSYLTLDPEGMIVDINMTGANLLGQMRSKLLQRRFVIFVRLQDRVCCNEHFQSVLLHEMRSTSECAIELDDGSLVDVRVDCLRVTEDDKTIGLSLALTDISERRRYERMRAELARTDP